MQASGFLLEHTLQLDIFDQGAGFSQASEHLRFTSSVAAFGMLLRDSEYKGAATYDKVIEWANESSSCDPHGYRSEFLELVGKAMEF
ncbi:MAG: DUF3520 domain-containing protein [Saprospirales bacterium]|nr:DUF3520 domain-containing protein [Saprospirales bacterium]